MIKTLTTAVAIALFSGSLVMAAQGASPKPSATTTAKPAASQTAVAHDAQAAPKAHAKKHRKHHKARRAAATAPATTPAAK